MKRALMAVAGSGKTTALVESLSRDRRTLLLTYTDNNAANLVNCILSKFGCIPVNIKVSTWFSFVLGFLVKPFSVPECPKIRKLDFKDPPQYATGIDRFLSCSGGLFHCRSFEFARKRIGAAKIMTRISRFFDEVLIDEVQDFAGFDFDFIEMLGESGLSVTLAGDFYQHTYDTSRDGSKNKNLHGTYEGFKRRLAKWYMIDETSLSASWRCSPEVCNFISEKIGICISSANKPSGHTPRLLSDIDSIRQVMANPSVTKLFYQKWDSYEGKGANWGACKGLSFGDVCVVLNKKTSLLFRSNRLQELASSTRNKLYVACSRTRGKLFFVYESDIGSFKKQRNQEPVA